MSDTLIQKGHVLVAEPALTGDVSFSRAVILIAEHNLKGSVGFILNKPLSYTLDELIEEIHFPYPVFNGGPVEQDNIYFIHIAPKVIPGSIEISDGIYWGGDFSALLKALEQNLIAENQIKFFLGYTGWSQKQLDGEIKTNSWITVKNLDISTLVKQENHSLWKDSIKALGGKYLIWSNTPENPSLN
jgi:putative transcriptional regulator